jgi:hypothetical protein
LTSGAAVPSALVIVTLFNNPAGRDAAAGLILALTRLTAVAMAQMG